VLFWSPLGVDRDDVSAHSGSAAPLGSGNRRKKPAKFYNREDRMNNQMEITERERLSREDAAARLHALADALARHNDVEFDRGGVHFKVHVPDEVDFKLEIEFEDEEREIEIELKW
jgi:amphi-Trp domain-containing protein